jgi:hypothetical protein
MSVERTANPTRPTSPPARVFTVESANQSLVYVRRIVHDVTVHYARLNEWRAERDHCIAAGDARERIEELGQLIDETVDTLNRLYDELAAVGCELKDWATGLVDFPSERDGRPICLCWRLGEPRVAWWHELQAGYAGRLPIIPDPA